ncbi:MAG: phytanoyl-CoA dioxygenase family protein [Candidatus Poribacteria bacterium]|nr:phytanoyl-CoA dioxygenase family protein [Candidatus Poribacteria bacterium]
MHLTAQQRDHYKEQGFVVIPHLFDTATVTLMREHYMKRRAEGPKPGDTGGTTDHADDPNHQFPRMINMHNWDELTEEWAADTNLLTVTEKLIDDTPVLLQTMLYFKPPGARGQALHQDEQYITIEPIIGVWVALDTSDAAVGRMVLIPRSHQGGLLSVEAADTAISFTNVQAVKPKNAEELGIDMAPGDTLFFDGKVIHGSYMNKTPDRWRRSFICHYMGENSQRFEPTEGTHVSHLKK